MKSNSCSCLGRASAEIEAPIPVHHVSGFGEEKIQPRGLRRKNSKLQTHVEVLRCRLGKPVATPEANGSLHPSKNWTPIYYAVYHQREAALTHFLQTGGSPDDVDGTGQPPLCIAVVNGYDEIVKVLLNAGANLNTTMRDTGETALHLAIKNNHAEIVNILLEAGPELEAHTTATKETPLHYAASKSGSLATVVSLLKRGAKYDALNSKGQSPAEAALLANNIQGAVAIINAAGSRRHNLAKEKEMLLKHVERSQNRFSIGNELIADIFAAACDPDSTVLVEAIKRDDASLVEMFLSKGADPDRPTARGERPIFVALDCAGAPVVQALVKHNADVTVRDMAGLSVLQAAFEGSIGQDKDSICAVFECLLSKGPNVQDTYMDGKTLLHRAVSCEFSYAKVAHLLLKSGINVNFQDGNGNTALHLATHSKSCMEVLLKNGASANITNRDGLTPLLYAISHIVRDNEPELEALIKASDIRKPNKQGQCVLHLAASRGLEKTVRILLRARAETSAVDANKQTPLLLAVLNHQWHIVPLLTIAPSINSWDNQGMTALHHIASSTPKAPWTWKDTAKAAVPFCERGVSRSMRDRSGATPLITAMKTLPEDGLPVVDTLLMPTADKRASWNCIGHEDHDGRDALYYAITLRKPAFVEALLKNGASFTFNTWVPGRKQLDASLHVDKQIMKHIAQHEWLCRAGTLRKQPAGSESESQKSLFEKTFPTKDLGVMISMGLDPNVLPKSTLGSSLLWVLLRQIPLRPLLSPAYLLDTMKLVLEHTADPNVGTARAGRRPPSPQAPTQDKPLSLHTLTFLLEEHPTVSAELVTLLLKKGTKLSIASPFYSGRYPLHSATKANRTDLVEEFIRQQADINCVDLQGRTPLFIAAKSGFSEVVDALLRHDAQIHLNDNEGNTVLHAAVMGGSESIVAMLLRAGVKGNISNAKNQTPTSCISKDLDIEKKKTIANMLQEATEREETRTLKNPQTNTTTIPKVAKTPQINKQAQSKVQVRHSKPKPNLESNHNTTPQTQSLKSHHHHHHQQSKHPPPSILTKLLTTPLLPKSKLPPQEPPHPIPTLKFSLHITTPTAHPPPTNPPHKPSAVAVGSRNADADANANANVAESRDYGQEGVFGSEMPKGGDLSREEKGEWKGGEFEEWVVLSRLVERL